MRLPTRRSETLAQGQTRPSDDVYLTPEAIERIKRQILELVAEKPHALAELQRTQEMGDLSENFGYQEAKARLRHINGRILTLEERLKTAVTIEAGTAADGIIRIGSTVTIETSGKRSTFQILGSQEANPLKGNISYLSPLGSLLMGHSVGDEVTLKTSRDIAYTIVEVR